MSEEKASQTASGTPSTPTLRPILPAPAAAGNGPGKPVAVAVRVENEVGLSINQQLASHLASQVTAASGGKLPLAKRKRGSMDSPLTGFKAKQPIELKRIGFIGAGNMARALAEGWIVGGT